MVGANKPAGAISQPRGGLQAAIAQQAPEPWGGSVGTAYGGLLKEAQAVPMAMTYTSANLGLSGGAHAD